MAIIKVSGGNSQGADPCVRACYCTFKIGGGRETRIGNHNCTHSTRGQIKREL